MNKKDRRGFTLIEVLIVVVIIGVLAALVVPRFMSAPEKAIVAEANQLIGSIIRAQQVNTDMGAGFTTISDNTTAATWNRLGMSPPGAASKFNFTCSSNQCAAVRSGAANKRVTLTVAGVWSCGSEYTTLANGGCALS